MSEFKGRLPRLEVPPALLETQAEKKGLDHLSGRTLEVTKGNRLINRLLKVSVVFAAASVVYTAVAKVPSDYVDKAKKVVLPQYAECKVFQEKYDQCTNVKNKRPDQCIDHLDALRQCRAALIKPSDLSYPAPKS